MNISREEVPGPMYTFLQQPTLVGFWVLYPGGVMTTQFAVYKKPTDAQIQNTKDLLGWGWKDA